jgi:hypothetical protein
MLYPLVGGLTVGGVLLLFRQLTGEWPGGAIIASLLIVGAGLGLVLARINRLGAFEGLLGSPWFEARLHETLFRETARAARYQRDLTLVVVRRAGRRRINWRGHVRVHDYVIGCSNGWSVLVLPETPEASALVILRRIALSTGLDIQAAMVSVDGPPWSGERLSQEIVCLVRTTSGAGSVSVRRPTGTEQLPLAS